MDTFGEHDHAVTSEDGTLGLHMFIAHITTLWNKSQSSSSSSPSSSPIATIIPPFLWGWLGEAWPESSQTG